MLCPSVDDKLSLVALFPMPVIFFKLSLVALLILGACMILPLRASLTTEPPTHASAPTVVWERDLASKGILLNMHGKHGNIK